MFCEGTVQPKLDLIGQALTRDLGRRYGPDVAIDVPRLLAAEPGATPAGRRDWTRRLGLRTYNEIRKSRGLQPYPGPAVRCADAADDVDGVQSGLSRARRDVPD